ncbi:MAG TPA: serine/threonine-protein kinase, partial [Gemmataceae bacterium]|nr:serine/threonine-protein kinase [Gemmataceae bacterium]
MTSANDPHPNLEQLTAFDLGQLGPEEWSAVAAHVAACAECCARLEALPEDTLVSLLRSTADLARSRQPDTGDYTASEGSLSEPRADQPVPPELANHPRYRVCGVIGSGGMGTVYKAEHLLMGRTVALKVIHPNLTGNRAAVERFPREVKAAARLSHPNIVTAYDAEQAGELHFLVMEYVEGKTLDQVAAEGPVPVDRACDWVRQAALGLQHAHARGMVHRDIKPHNMLLVSGGVVSGEQSPGGDHPTHPPLTTHHSLTIKILDFGLARFASTTVPGEGLTPFGVVVGTPDYMAPEQALQPQHADIRSDIYSLGCTLYHLLAGRPPFSGGTPLQKLMAHQEQEPVPLRSHRQDIPEGLEVVLRRMMAKDPARRYQTPAEVTAALTPFARGQVEDAQTAEIVVGHPTPDRRWRRIVLAGGLLAVVVMVAGLVWALTRNGGQEEDTGGKPVRVIGGEKWGPFNRAAISDDGRFGLSANEDFTVGLWDLEEGKELCRLQGHEHSILGLAFSRDGKRALSGGRDEVVCFWDLERRKLIKKLHEHTSWARGVTFTLDHERGLSAGNDARV